MSDHKTTPSYRGRFAPSPTGPLHFGSLLAAASSYAQARHQQGQWLVRIEDVDLPRCDTSSTTQILKALETYGMHWDEDIIYQSQRNSFYQDALDKLAAQGDTYDCACTRKEINESAESTVTMGIYPGTCRNGLAKGKTARSIRMRTDDNEIVFVDKVQAPLSQHLLKDVGDFIIKRADNLFAYQLAVVVDDEAQAITEIVRGSDMLDSTPRQLFLQQRLGYSTPDYIHIPLAVNNKGQKLSKQNMAPAINLVDPRPTLINALEFLNQQPPADLRDTSIDDIWQWVADNWSVKNIPAKTQLAYNNNHE